MIPTEIIKTLLCENFLAIESLMYKIWLILKMAQKTQIFELNKSVYCSNHQSIKPQLLTKFSQIFSY